MSRSARGHLAGAAPGRPRAALLGLEKLLRRGLPDTDSRPDHRAGPAHPTADHLSIAAPLTGHPDPCRSRPAAPAQRTVMITDPARATVSERRSDRPHPAVRLLASPGVPPPRRGRASQAAPPPDPRGG